MNKDKDGITFILSYQKLVYFISIIFLAFSGIIIYTFYYFKKIHEVLENSVKEKNLLFDKQIADIKIQNIILKQQIIEANQKVGVELAPLNSIYTMDLTKMTGILLVCLAVILSVIGVYYLTIFFFKKTFLGQVISWTNYYACKGLSKLTGSSESKVFEVPISEDFDLKFILTGENECSVLYKMGDDNVFIPFESFLEHYKSLAGVKVDVSLIQESLIEGNSSNIIQVISNNESLPLDCTIQGVEALVQFF